VSGWSDIVQVAAGDYHTVGLQSDASVVAVGANWFGECDVETWDLVLAALVPVIDEIFYDADGSDEGSEYVILYNPTDGEVDLSGWKLQWGGTDFTYGYLDLAGMSIPALSTLIIGESLVPGTDVVVDFDPALQNGDTGSDGIRLIDAQGYVIDTVIYDSPNTSGLPGDDCLIPYPDEMCAPGVDVGLALSRDELHTDTNDCSADFSVAPPLWQECISDDTQPCDTGLLGICAAGTETCIDGFWGECVQDEPAVAEICDDTLDNDCDGLTDAADDDCWECTPLDTHPCDTGLLGICAAGTETCVDGFWAECVQDEAAEAEICDDTLDNDCDGLVDDDDPDCETFTLELTGSYLSGSIILDFTVGTPEPAIWATYLVLINPTYQVTPLWSVPFGIIDPPIQLPVVFTLPQMGWVGIFSGLYTDEGKETSVFKWIDTGWPGE